MRVKVFSADKKTYLGEGTVTGRTNIKHDGIEYSTPEIRLDGAVGKILYGCDCWYIKKTVAEKIEKELTE